MKELTPEFSRVLSVARIPKKGSEELIEAKPAEREALAKRFGLVAVPLLKANLVLTPGGRETVAVEGTIDAEVIQSCVVTLEPVESSLALEIDTVFFPAERQKADPKEPQEVEPDDNSETYEGGKIDIGELVAQHLGIGIDPYPRKKGAKLGVKEFGKKVEKQKPFAKLAAVVKIKKNKDKH